MKFFLGISFRRYSPILAEDLPLSKTDFDDIDLVKKTYEQISHTCFDSAIIFLIAFVLLLVAHRYTKRSNQNIKKFKQTFYSILTNEFSHISINKIQHYKMEYKIVLFSVAVSDQLQIFDFAPKKVCPVRAFLDRQSNDLASSKTCLPRCFSKAGARQVFLQSGP